MTKTKSTRKESLCLRGADSESCFNFFFFFFNLLKPSEFYRSVHACFWLNNRWRIDEDMADELDLDARPGSSDAENI